MEKEVTWSLSYNFRRVCMKIETTLKKEAAKQAERQAQVRQDQRGAAKATRRPKTNRREIKYTAD